MEPLARIQALAVSDTGFVFDPFTGVTYSLNRSGLTLLRGLSAALGRDALLARLREEFEVADDDLERDLDEFIQQLRESRLLPLEFVLD
jgi:PqqD family protein of HPr-rel-A system